MALTLLAVTTFWRHLDLSCNTQLSQLEIYPSDERNAQEINSLISIVLPQVPPCIKELTLCIRCRDDEHGQRLARALEAPQFRTLEKSSFHRPHTPVSMHTIIMFHFDRHMDDLSGVSSPT
jgi:hypothetical protein